MIINKINLNSVRNHFYWTGQFRIDGWYRNLRRRLKASRYTSRLKVPAAKGMLPRKKRKEKNNITSMQE